MKSNNYETYLKIIESLNLPVLFFGTEYSNISQIDCHLRERLVHDRPYLSFIEIFQKKTDSRILLKIKDFFELNYYFYKTPTYSSDGKCYISIGPILDYEMTEETLFTVIKRNHLPEKLIPELFTFYNHITTNENLDILDKTLLAITSNFFEQPVTIQTLPSKYLKDNLVNNASDFLPKYHMADTIENMYSLENHMMDAVSKGNADEAIKVFHLQGKLSFRSRNTANPLRDAKSRLVVLNVLLRKSIEKGGVHPIYIDDISAKYAQKIENCTSVSELNINFPINMIRDYCDVVVKMSKIKYPLLIQNCMFYIDNHYSEDIDLEMLSMHLFVTRQHLSSAFKKHTGITITEYIQKCRMNHAAEYLLNTSHSVTAIGQLCGFNNSAYFIKIFKKYYGATPKEYRAHPKKQDAT